MLHPIFLLAAPELRLLRWLSRVTLELQALRFPPALQDCCGNQYGKAKELESNNRHLPSGTACHCWR